MPRWAAFLGVRFAVTDLVAVAGRGSPSLLRGLDEAMAAGVVVEAGDSLAFRHPVVRDVVHRDMATPVRSALHRQAAEALARAGASTERVAEHLLAAQPTVDAWTASWLVDNRTLLVERTPPLAVRVLDSGLAGDADRFATPAHDTEAEIAAQKALTTTTAPALAAEMRHLLAALRRRQCETDEAVTPPEATTDKPDAPVEWRAGHRSPTTTARVSAALSAVRHDDAARTSAAKSGVVVGVGA